MTSQQRQPDPPRRLRLTLHSAFGLLPPFVRRRLVRLGTPSFTLGAVVALQHQGRTLVLRQAHRPDWGLPGGLLGRGETAEEALVREVHEELGLDLEPGRCLLTRVDPERRQVDLVYRVVLAARPQVAAHAETTRAEWLDIPALLTAEAPSEMTAAMLSELAEVPETAGEGRLRA